MLHLRGVVASTRVVRSSVFAKHTTAVRQTQQRLMTTTVPRRRIERLEQHANRSPGDAGAQEALLRELGHKYPQLVARRVESGKFAGSEGVFKEYIKALASLGQINNMSVESILRPLSGTQPSMSSGSNAQFSAFPAPHANSGYGSSPMMGGSAYMGGQQAQSPGMFSGAFDSFNAAGAGAAGANGVNGAAPAAAAAALQVELVEPGFRTQMWKTGRFLFVCALVVGIGSQIVDEKLPKGMGMNKGVEPAMDQGKCFDDVKGADEAKEELEEIVAYLKNPETFTRLGGKLPKGVLLTGAPGTGKTLLAKAVAGEAGVPFFYASGSEFEEMYVGVGAKRVRDLFGAAKKRSPCIVFIDEIDAIGSTRALKEQNAMKMTLNQLLVELDGFKETEGVIIIGATNFPETLDPALIRPGRFDRNVVVPLPDIKGRREILKLYLAKVPCDETVSVDTIARGTPGASGAELANLVNIAALRASQDGADFVTHADLEHAKDKVLMGAERKAAVIPESVRRVTAFHEGGHAMVAMHTNGAMPVHKATIMPRGQALGMVHQLPEEQDMLQRSRRQMLAELDVCMGGRVAEELLLGADDVTSGASSDLQKATQIARRMVSLFGMDRSGGVGMLYVPSNKNSEVSNETKHAVDEEVKRLLTESYARSKALLHKHNKELTFVAEALLEYETLTAEEIKLAMKGKFKKL